MRKFRLAIVDGFAGGGKYSEGQSGSPLIFLEELKNAIIATNIKRAAEKSEPIQFECLLIFNDNDKHNLEALRKNVFELKREIDSTTPGLYLDIHFLNEDFDTSYKKISTELSITYGFQNVIFNLDQFGYTGVNIEIIKDIMVRFKSPEIFLTFSIDSLLIFMQKNDPNKLKMNLRVLGSDIEEFIEIDKRLRTTKWLGAAERLIYEEFRHTANYFSPFAIYNPDGWMYWSLHFSKNYRARQEYNDVLHANSSHLAHQGRSGLEMLTYDIKKDFPTHLFDKDSRERSKLSLHQDIPEFIRKSGDSMYVSDFYEGIYNLTPSHSDDIHEVLIESPDITIITENGGERRSKNTINLTDIISLNPQASFFPFFNNTKK